MAQDYFVYVGGHTAGFLFGEEKIPAKGIVLYRFDSTEGTLEYVETTEGLMSPSFIAFHPTLPALYAVERYLDHAGVGEGAVSSFAIDDESGHLTPTARVSSVGISPPHVSAHPSGGHVYAAHYASGHVVAFPLDDEGRVEPADTVIVQSGSSTHERQEAAHPHMVRPSKSGKFLFVPDLGRNTLSTYATTDDGTLSPAPSSEVTLPPETGPRHFAWHPSERFAFTNGELSNTMCVLRYDADAGTFELIGAHSTLPEGYDEESSTSEIICHPSGNVVYVSNRGHDSIAVFDFDASTGEAVLRGTQSSFGSWPRNFAIDPTNTFMIVANQVPGNLVIFRLDPETHWPEPTGYSVETGVPTCILFRPIPA